MYFEHKYSITYYELSNVRIKQTYSGKIHNLLGRWIDIPDKIHKRTLILKIVAGKGSGDIQVWKHKNSNKINSTLGLGYYCS